MKLKLSFFFITLYSVSMSFSQEKNISISDIYDGLFYAESVRGIQPTNNGELFSLLTSKNSDLYAVELFDYKNFQKQGTLIDALGYSHYTLSSDGNKILLGGDFTPIYRHSKLGKYAVYDIKTQKLTAIFNNQIQEPLFSNDGNSIAFSYQNNLYINNLETEKITQITTDGKINQIINGISDWVYEEEFSVVRQFDWSKNNIYLAYIQFDESQVPEFSMDIYEKKLYPTQQVFKYPKAGEPNSKVSIKIYNTISETTEIIPTEGYYIPHLQWDNKNNILFYELNRQQNNFKIIRYNLEKKQREILYQEIDKAYVSIENLTFHLLPDNSFLITSEKDGFNHIYHYNEKGKLIRQITKGNWQITGFYGYNPSDKNIYFQSTQRGSIYRDVYKISIKGGTPTLLSTEKGTNRAEFSSDYSYYLLFHESSIIPPSVSVFQTKNNKKIKQIVNNQNLTKLIDSYSTSRKEFKTLNINGQKLNSWILKPQNFDPNKKYPLLMYQYSGPGSQSVSDRWFSYDDYWYLSLTQKGYIVACVDARGTGFKGADFKKITQFQLGKYETDDQIKSAEYFASLPYIDTSRIGIWGWSFGGFIATSALLKGNHIFKMAIAVAPVTNWRLYDSIYTERYMNTPQENPKGYDNNSPLNFANQLSGKYLLIHGSADDNVHIQNSMRLIEALVQADKDFNWAIYPDKDHSIYGGNTRKHLFKKITKFILNNL